MYLKEKLKYGTHSHFTKRMNKYNNNDFNNKKYFAIDVKIVAI